MDRRKSTNPRDIPENMNDDESADFWGADEVTEKFLKNDEDNEELRKEIENDPELKAMLEEAEENVKAGRSSYSVEEAREILREGHFEEHGDDEEIRMEIEPDPELKRILEKADEDIKADRTYSSEQTRERLEQGSNLPGEEFLETLDPESERPRKCP